MNIGRKISVFVPKGLKFYTSTLVLLTGERPYKSQVLWKECWFQRCHNDHVRRIASNIFQDFYTGVRRAGHCAEVLLFTLQHSHHAVEYSIPLDAPRTVWFFLDI